MLESVECHEKRSQEVEESKVEEEQEETKEVWSKEKEEEEEKEKEEEEKEEEEKEKDKLQNGRSWSSAKLSQTPSPHCLNVCCPRQSGSPCSVTSFKCFFYFHLFELFRTAGRTLPRFSICEMVGKFNFRQKLQNLQILYRVSLLYPMAAALNHFYTGS